MSTEKGQTAQASGAEGGIGIERIRSTQMHRCRISDLNWAMRTETAGKVHGEPHEVSCTLCSSYCQE